MHISKTEPGEPIRSEGRGARSAAAFAVGLLLLGAAVWAIASQRSSLADACIRARNTPWYYVAAMLLLPLLNFSATTSLFCVLTRRYGRVGWREMGALIGSAWLLNFLPMRPGMVSRLAYHKKVNGIRIQDSVKVLVAASASTGFAVVTLLSLVLALGADAQVGSLISAAAIPPVALALLALVISGRQGQAWRWPAAAALRYIDVTIWAVRYWLAFTMIGKPVTPVGAAAVTLVGQAAMLAPVQIGFREWVIGAAAALLPAEWSPVQTPPSPGAMAAVAPGLMADVAMRAAELAIAIPLGLASSLWLWHRLGRQPPRSTHQNPCPDPDTPNPAPENAL